MSKDFEVSVHHITRVEGHGNIHFKTQNGKISVIQWQVPEAPRFFEGMVVGRPWDDIQTIVSRICGICSVTHSLAAVKAIEAAMGVEISWQTEMLRTLLHYAEQVESHILHIGYLVAPDLLGVKSVVPLISSHPELVKKIIALHRLGNEWMELIGGRRTHPITLRIGGFASLPEAREFKLLAERIRKMQSELFMVVDAIAGLADKLPDFNRPTEYVALVEPGKYTFYEGDIGSSDVKERVPVSEFERVVNEYVSPQSTAKWAKWHRASYAVGALARFNINADYLLSSAKGAAKKLGLKRGSCNPFYNTIAQAVEVAQVIEDALILMDELLVRGVHEEKNHVQVREGDGAGALEAPRGVLFHRYAFDRNGICVKANLCIPTNQNHANIQKDMEALAPSLMEKEPGEAKQILEMLVRAYDPCVSCSTH
jgi:coenzyme F420-reducing hydrogenase alpha subunit